MRITPSPPKNLSQRVGPSRNWGLNCCSTKPYIFELAARLTTYLSSDQRCTQKNAFKPRSAALGSQLTSRQSFGNFSEMADRTLLTEDRQVCLAGNLQRLQGACLRVLKNHRPGKQGDGNRVFKWPLLTRAVPETDRRLSHSLLPEKLAHPRLC